MFKNGVGLTEVEIDVDGRLAAGSFLRHTSQSQQWTKPRSDPTKPHNTLKNIIFSKIAKLNCEAQPVKSRQQCVL